MAELPATPDELLLRLVEADEGIRPDRDRFILFRVMGSGQGLPVQHPGLGEEGLSAREQDLEDLADDGYVRLDRRPKAWHFDVTRAGFDHAHRLRQASESPASAEDSGTVAERGDKYFHLAGGTIIVRAGTQSRPWLVTWLPDRESDPGYPGFTLSSTLGEVPTGPTVAALVEWARRQPWALRAAAPLESGSPEGRPPATAETLDMPPDEWSSLQRDAFDAGWRLGVNREPDGGVSWAILNDRDEPIARGVSESWDDAFLEIYDHLHLPSGEP